jgi:hypothetical protein
MTPAEQDWMRLAYPVFERNCIQCHASADAVGFLAGSTPLEVRETLLSWSPPVVDIDNPTTSRVLSKGVHLGPSLTAQETSDILEWLQAEREAGTTGN